MTHQAAVATVRAEQIEGLRELIAQVIAEEGERLMPRQFLADVEEIKRSPIGAVIRMEGDIQRLWDGQQALRAEMKEGQDALWKGQDALWKGQEALRREMKEGQEALRVEFKKDLAHLEKVMNARFEGVEARFDQFEKRLIRSDFWVKFFAGLVTALFIAQLVLTLIK